MGFRAELDALKQVKLDKESDGHHHIAQETPEQAASTFEELKAELILALQEAENETNGTASGDQPGPQGDDEMDREKQALEELRAAQEAVALEHRALEDLRAELRASK